MKKNKSTENNLLALNNLVKRIPQIPKNIFSNILELKWICSFFLIFLFAQLAHIALTHWDKVAYVFGGKWFCGEQIYFEFIRPPLPSFLNCLFGATDFSMVLTTALACIVYFAAIVLIYKKNSKNLNQLIFALFAFLFPAILFNSNYGSDLLALSFLLLAFALDGPLKKGFLFGLATLSRYNFLLFGLVFIFELRKKPKAVIKFLLVTVLLWIPWMIYNYLFTGNPLFSIMESSFLNVAQKGLAAPFFPDQLAVMLFFLALVFILDFKKNLGLILSQSGVLSVLMFVISGIKETRFINLLTPAIAFNAALFAGKDKRKIVLLVVIFFLFMYFSPKPGHSELLMPSDSFIKDCRVASDEWVFFYNQGVVAECLYDITSWRAFVSSGGSIVLYNYSGQDLNSIGGEFIQREGYVIIKSSSCAPQPKKYISGSKRMEVLKWLRDTNSTFYDYSDWVE